MLKSNSIKNTLEKNNRLPTEENKKDKVKKEENKNFKAFTMNTNKTKQNSKILKDKVTNLKKSNLNVKNENLNNTTKITTNRTNRNNPLKNSFSKKEELTIKKNELVKNNIILKKTVTKAKSDILQIKINSNKSLKEDDIKGLLTEEKTKIKVLPVTANKSLIKKYDRQISSGSIKDFVTTPKAKSKVNPIGTQPSSLKKSSSIPKFEINKKKVFKYPDKVIKELEESKIKEENSNTEDMKYKRLNTINPNDRIKSAYNTISAKSFRKTPINLTKSPNKTINTENKLTIKERPKSVFKRENSDTNTIKNKVMNNTTGKGNFLKVSNKNNINNLKLNNTLKTTDKPRPKSTFKKPESEIKLNEASLSTEASSHFRGKIEDYAIGKEIGKGAYAIVKQALHKPTNKKMAIKIYEKVKLLDTQRKNSVKREIQILKKLDHNNIVKLQEVIDNPKQILLVMELVNGVSLLNFLKSKSNKRIDESQCKFIFQQIVEAISHCHHKQICHRDIKLENIIVEENNIIKVIDFGFGTVTNDKLLNFFCGTPSYMPPEIVQKKDYIGQFADIWSLGILLYTLLCGAFPFRAMSEKELYAKIIKGVFNLPEYMSKNAGDLINKILNLKAVDRPTAEEILNDFWFHNNENENFTDIITNTNINTSYTINIINNIDTEIDLNLPENIFEEEASPRHLITN